MRRSSPQKQNKCSPGIENGMMIFQGHTGQLQLRYDDWGSIREAIDEQSVDNGPHPPLIDSLGCADVRCQPPSPPYSRPMCSGVGCRLSPRIFRGARSASGVSTACGSAGTLVVIVFHASHTGEVNIMRQHSGVNHPL